MNDIEELRYRFKSKRINSINNSKKERTSNVIGQQRFIFKLVNKTLITVLLFLATSIFIKT